MRLTISFVIVFLFVVNPLFAFETDQFNLPPERLDDIGSELQQHVTEKIEQTLEKLNAKIQKTVNDKKLSEEKRDSKLRELLSDEILAKEVFKTIGDGMFPQSKIENWIKSHKFESGNISYKTSYKNSIYVTAPFNYLTLSPTIRVYGVEFGTDKMAHLFQQGYSYLKIYKKEMAKGASQLEAYQRAVKWGKRTEKTYYGTLVSGVYSNADLAANYAGLKFYLSLTESQKIGDTEIVPLVVRENGLWKINEVAHADFLKPFITQHLNEAYNPSRYFSIAEFRKVVIGVIKKRACLQWRERFSELDSEKFAEIRFSTRVWNGEDYGYTPSESEISIGEICFESNSEPQQKKLFTTS